MSVFMTQDSLYESSERAAHTWPISFAGPAGPFVFITIFGVFLSFLLLINRLFWRIFKGKPGLDDIFIIVAWSSLLALSVISLKAVEYGYGRPQRQLLQHEASNAIQMFFIFQVLYKITINFSKLSILALYIRVFGPKDWFGQLTHIMMLIVGSYIISSLVATTLQCRPITKNWDTTDHVQGECIDTLRFWYANALYNIISEAIMVFSVWYKVWKLENINLRQKLNLSIVLGLGVFVFITSILRMTTLAPTALTNDKTGGTLLSTTWSTVEASLAIVCASLPMLRQLLKVMWPKCFEIKRISNHTRTLSTDLNRPFAATSPEPLVRRLPMALDQSSERTQVPERPGTSPSLYNDATETLQMVRISTAPSNYGEPAKLVGPIPKVHLKKSEP